MLHIQKTTSGSITQRGCKWLLSENGYQLVQGKHHWKGTASTECRSLRRKAWHHTPEFTLILFCRPPLASSGPCGARRRSTGTCSCTNACPANSHGVSPPSSSSAPTTAVSVLKDVQLKSVCKWARTYKRWFLFAHAELHLH